MDADAAPSGVIDWVILTRGDRPAELVRAIDSIRRQPAAGDVVVVVNGADTSVAERELDGVDLVMLPENIGVPAGRDVGLRRCRSQIVGFLDDDARLETADACRRVLDAFAEDHLLGVVSLRLTDEDGATARRHVPRVGRRGHDASGEVVTFLGGASVVRRQAYDAAGSYWGELFYGHEELDLAWRMADQGFHVRYDSSVTVFHPRTEIGRHADGWRYTGRNRVLVARRNLPWAIALPHVLGWLVVGFLRAPTGACRRSYVAGWRSGWRMPVERRPIGWGTVWRLTRLGRPPVL